MRYSELLEGTSLKAKWIAIIRDQFDAVFNHFSKFSESFGQEFTLHFPLTEPEAKRIWSVALAAQHIQPSHPVQPVMQVKVKCADQDVYHSWHIGSIYEARIKLGVNMPDATPEEYNQSLAVIFSVLCHEVSHTFQLVNGMSFHERDMEEKMYPGLGWFGEGGGSPHEDLGTEQEAELVSLAQLLKTGRYWTLDRDRYAPLLDRLQPTSPYIARFGRRDLIKKLVSLGCTKEQIMRYLQPNADVQAV